MSICFLPYVHDQVRDIWMVPRAARDDPDSFELSVSNANGADLLCTLGLAPEPGGGPVPIEHFAGLVTSCGASPSRPPFTSARDRPGCPERAVDSRPRRPLRRLHRTPAWRPDDSDTTKPRRGRDTFRVGLTTRRARSGEGPLGSRHAECTRSSRCAIPPLLPAMENSLSRSM